VEAIPNAMFLDDDVAELPTGLRIIGSTLWSHVPDHELENYTRMFADNGRGVDDDDIRLGNRLMTIQDTNELHRQARSFLEQELRALSPAERSQTIVCTHFWPTLQPLAGPDGQPPPYLHLAGSDLDALIAECGPRLWLCGHEHTKSALPVPPLDAVAADAAADDTAGEYRVKHQHPPLAIAAQGDQGTPEESQHDNRNVGTKDDGFDGAHDGSFREWATVTGWSGVLTAGAAAGPARAR
jgi:hypothetical protein